jgi:hypothetical protein
MYKIQILKTTVLGQKYTNYYKGSYKIEFLFYLIIKIYSYNFYLKKNKKFLNIKKMPPKKTSQKKTPRFTAKLNPEQRLKKELKLEKDEKKILKNLLIKNVESDVDSEEEEKIRLFITSLNKKKIDVFEKEIKRFIYDNPTEYRTELFEKINANLSDKEKKLLFIRYLNQDDMSLEIVYNDFISIVRQDEIIRNFLEGLNKIYSEAEDKITKMDDKDQIKQLKKERNEEILEKINKFQRQKNVLPVTSEIFDAITSKLPMKKMIKLIQLYLKQNSLTFKQFYNKFLDEDYDELEIKEFLSNKDFENILRHKTKTDVIIKMNELLDKDPEKKELIKNIFEELDMQLIRRLIRTYLDQFYEDPKDRVSFEIFVNKFLEDKYVQMYQNRQQNLKTLLAKKHKEDEARKQREIDLLFEDVPVETVDLVDITPNINLISILNGPVTKDIKDHAAKLVSENLLKFSNMRIEYEIDSDYILDIINIAADTSRNVREFLTKIGNIIVYLISGLSKYEVYINKNTFILKPNDVFVKNIANVFYEPSVLLELTPEQKLPEIFENDSISEKQKSDVLYNLNLKLKYFILNFVDYIYRFRNMHVRIDYKGSLPTIPNIETIIEESYPFGSDMIQFENENVIYYDPELNMTFLLKTKDVLEQIENNDYINKISNTKFHPDFVKNVGYLFRKYKKEQEEYADRLKEEVNMIKYFDPDLKRAIKFSKPDLWKQFEEGNYNNAITNKPFDPNFVKEMQYLRSILLEKEKEENIILQAKLRKEGIKEKIQNYSILEELYDDLEQMESL